MRDEKGRKISLALKGRRKSEEHKRKMSETRKRLFREGKLTVWNKRPKIKLYCKLCNKEFGVNKYRTNTAKFCCKKCYSEWETGLNNHRYGKHLSEEAKRKLSMMFKGKRFRPPLTEETREKMRKNGRERFQKGLLSKFIIKAKYPSEETKRKISLSGKGKHRESKSEEHKKKLSETRKRLIKEGKIKLSKKVLENQNSKSKIEFYKKYPKKHPNFILSRKNHVSFIEKRIKTFLEEELHLKEGKDFFFNEFDKTEKTRRYPDFQFPKLNIIIEADGEYWHKNKEIDKSRDIELSNAGWLIHHFLGTDIVNNFEIVKEKIDSLLKVVS